MKTYDMWLSEGYLYSSIRKNQPIAHKMGCFIDEGDPNILEPEIWNDTVCKAAIKDYANIIADLNITDERVCKKYKTFIELIIKKLSQRTYKSARALDVYIQSIRFNVDEELRLAGY